MANASRWPQFKSWTLIFCVSGLFCEHENLVVQHFSHAAVEVEEEFLAIFVLQLGASLLEDGNHGGVVLQYLEQTAHAGELHQGDLAGIDGSAGGSDFKCHGSLFCGFKFFLALLDGFFDGADEGEGGLGQVVEFAVENHVEALDGVFDVDELAGDAGELFGHEERL